MRNNRLTRDAVVLLHPQVSRQTSRAKACAALVLLVLALVGEVLS